MGLELPVTVTVAVSTYENETNVTLGGHSEAGEPRRAQELQRRAKRQLGGRVFWEKDGRSRNGVGRYEASSCSSAPFPSRVANHVRPLPIGCYSSCGSMGKQ